MTPVVLRPAWPADAAAIAEIHVDVWRRTYRDLAPAAAFDALDVPRRRAQWDRILGDPDQIALVADGDGTLAGFALAGPAGEPVFDGRAEVKFLYIGHAFARQGLGRRLLAALAAAVRDRGGSGIGLGVVAGNDRAIAFYEAMGGRRIGAYTDPGPLWRSDNLAYAWDDLAALAAKGM